jgi:NADP-dependent aldehyde dehydrogenase
LTDGYSEHRSADRLAIDSQLGDTPPAQLAVHVAAAVKAAPAFGATSPEARASMLRLVADRLVGAADDLVPLAIDESHLPEGRLQGELRRTTFQLRLMASTLLDGGYLDATIDNPNPTWPSGARPDLRRILRPLGPVVVFAASNFPFAFSVAGGDTASALAAGCPVILKAHPGHVRLSAATGRVVGAALRDAGAPEGVWAVVYGEQAGRDAVCHPGITAGAFTGSLRGGRALFDLAVSRPVPIAFFGELGSVNPVFVTRAAFAQRSAEILAGYVDSFTLGAGQFCTKPGILLVPAERGADDQLRSLVLARTAAPLLNDSIATAYREGLDRLMQDPSVAAVVEGNEGNDAAPTPSLLSTTAADLVARPDALMVECFGPTSLLVTYTDEEELLQAARAFDGQLTAAIHAEDHDPIAAPLLEILTGRAGRVLWNEWPTGVSVTWAMQHGGPYPATTAPQTTSVGAAAIGRFLRPVAYQSVPDHLLPAALQDANPLRLPRRVDGQLTVPTRLTDRPY